MLYKNVSNPNSLASADVNSIIGPTDRDASKIEIKVLRLLRERDPDNVKWVVFNCNPAGPSPVS